MKRKFTSFKGKFLDWPFEEYENVTLHWVQSPQMEGLHNQWMSKAVFRKENGNLHEYLIPWGSLPILKLGETFKDGSPTGSKLGKKIKLNFDPDIKIEEMEAGRILERGFYPLETRLNLEEHCLVIRGNKIVVIPCLELIRFFFLVNKQMSYKILEPYSFNDWVSASIANLEVTMEFNKNVALKNMTDLFVQIIAKILFVPSWNTAWKQVYAKREEKIIKKKLDPKSKIPLSCIPPVLQGNSWTVRAIEHKNEIIVLEIIAYEDKSALPFNKIRCKHPGFKIYKPGFYSKEGQVYTQKPRLRIKRFSRPLNVKDPLLIPFSEPIHKEVNPITVEEIAVETQSRDLRKSRIGIPVNPGKLIDSLNSVSLNDEGGYGESQAADFLPINDNPENQEGFEKFLKAVGFMRVFRPNLNISHQINTVPDDSPLAYCGTNRRRYVLVKVNSSTNDVSIIEFDLSDGHSISTLFVSPSDSKQINNLFVDCMYSNGSWDRDQLYKKKKLIKTRLAKHITDNPLDWSKKLLEKLEQY